MANPTVSVQAMADYFQWHVECGRGDWQVEFDMYSLPCRHCQLMGIRPAGPARMIDKEKKIVFISAVPEP